MKETRPALPRVLCADKMRSWTFMGACQRYVHCSEYVLILLACIGSHRGRSGTDLQEPGCRSLNRAKWHLGRLNPPVI